MLPRLSGLEMVADEMKVAFKGANTELSKNEFLLLKFFLENTGKILSRDEIIKNVWGEDYYISDTQAGF
ncbi:MAG: winged helix-turn-helix transcriptional regulator [Treponema sp.]|nr:winged helix-turn-helix transcriptional regulator [Treponema sp.]